MSNPWAQSFEDLRSPYLQEKKAKKDYDGDGKIESGAKEYRGVVHNKIQKAKGGKADGQDTSSVKEHHQKDANGNPVEHGDGTPSNVDEAKIDQIDPKNKRKRRNEVSFGKQTKPYDPPTKAYKNEMGKFLQKQRKERHDRMRGTTYKRPKSSDSKYEEISYTAAYLPSNVDEAKVDQGMSTAKKRATRNERRRGEKDAPFNSLSKTKVSKLNQEYRQDDHKERRGVKKEKGKMTLQDRVGKMRGMSRANSLKQIAQKATKIGVSNVKKDGSATISYSHYEPDGDVISEADKKGKGSGTKDACYHKVKSRYSVWPSAYASGALVKCRKVGAKNWGSSSKKEEFDYYQMPMKSFGDMVGECWKTHEQRGMKMKGGKMVPNCVRKGTKSESVEEKETMKEKYVKMGGKMVDKGDYVSDFKKQGGYLNSPARKKADAEYAKNNPKRKPFEKRKIGTLAGNKLNDEVQYEAVKSPKLDIKETGVKNKIEINPEIKTEAAKAPVKK